MSVAVFLAALLCHQTVWAEELRALCILRALRALQAYFHGGVIDGVLDLRHDHVLVGAQGGGLESNIPSSRY